MSIFPPPKKLEVTGGVYRGAVLDEREFARHGHRFDAVTGVSPEAYTLRLSPEGLAVQLASPLALRHAYSSYRQWLDLHQRSPVPCVSISDAPDFRYRGFILDISRTKVPKQEELRQLVRRLAALRYNHFQLYTEHTFEHPHHLDVHRFASPLSSLDLRELNALCASLGIELCANQNVFGHMERWLKHPMYRRYAERADGFTTPWGEHRPTGSVCKPDAASYHLIRSIFREVLPNFTSDRVNIGCDETFELGQGLSRHLVSNSSQRILYRDFLDRIARMLDLEHNRSEILFWADVLLNDPKGSTSLPSILTPLVWGYEARHPFKKQLEQISRVADKHWVCPGTSTWNSFSGRTDTMLANISAATRAGHDASSDGMLLTDWGDGGHLQQFEASYPALAFASARAWNVSADATDAIKASDRYLFRGECRTLDWANLGRIPNFLSWHPENSSPLFSMFLQRSIHREGLSSIATSEIHAVHDHILEQIDGSSLTETQVQTLANQALGAACELSIRGESVTLHPLARVAPERHVSLWRQRNREGGLAESLRSYTTVCDILNLTCPAL